MPTALSKNFRCSAVKDLGSSAGFEASTWYSSASGCATTAAAAWRLLHAEMDRLLSAQNLDGGVRGCARRERCALRRIGEARDMVYIWTIERNEHAMRKRVVRKSGRNVYDGKYQVIDAMMAKKKVRTLMLNHIHVTAITAWHRSGRFTRNFISPRVQIEPSIHSRRRISHATQAVFSPLPCPTHFDSSASPPFASSHSWPLTPEDNVLPPYTCSY